MTFEVFIRRICAALEHHHIPYMVTGSVASSIHGIPRSTNDLDIVIAPDREQLRELVYFVNRFGYFAQTEAAEDALRKRDQFNIIDFPNAWKVDLIIRKEREFSVTEFAHREEVEVGLGSAARSPVRGKWVAELDLQEQWNTVRALAG